MGFFNKLFGNNDGGNNDLLKTAEPMDENIYWAILQRSLDNSSDQAEQSEYLDSEIEKLPPVQMVQFKLRTDKLSDDTYTSEMWCAGYIINGGCSDDGFDYFRSWVIGRGKTVYYKAKQNPDTLVTVLDEDGDHEFEDLDYIPVKAFKNKTSKDQYSYIDNEKVQSKRPPIEFTWQEENPDSMKKICPQLFEKCWDK